jgi:hypothetical protein
MNDHRHPAGNPQGKGMVPVLDQLRAIAPWDVAVKSPEKILRDYCLSSLVLSAVFKFRTVPGNTYYLYRVGSEWQLSLITPKEWGARLPGAPVASCELAKDMTWSIALTENVADDAELVMALQQFIAGFAERLGNAKTLESSLPVYEINLPYQQRMMATALSASLRGSLILSGLTGGRSTDWLQRLGVENLLGFEPAKR